MSPLSLSLLATIGVAVAMPSMPRDVSEVCKNAEATNGCCPFCGYEPVKAGNDMLCMPTGERIAFPFTLDEDDQQEYCQMVAANHGCNDVCGYSWNEELGACSKVTSAPQPKKSLGDAPIIGGSGKYRYQYMPDLLKAPAGATLVNCHGLVTDSDKNIYLTYQNDGKTDQNCLIKWKPDGTDGVFMTGGNSTLCSGTPHGLKIKTEGGVEYLYHANNNQKLTKTTLDGDIIWQKDGFFGQNAAGLAAYRPTWFATPPDSDYMYLCDGYGSNQVYAFSTDGKFMNKTWGGRSKVKGPGAAHGTFSTNHGCTYDSRLKDTIVVSDRANSRFEFFNYDPASYDKFDYSHTVNMIPFLGTGTLPCNLRMYPDLNGMAITPDLSGPVGVLDETNAVVSIVKVSELLAADQHKHPHDAIFLPNGDMVVATWAPGRISYWKLLPVEDEVAEM